MKLKDVVQIAVLTVIGFAIGMVISMFTGTMGSIALYVSAGLAAFVVGPVFVIMAKRVKKRGAAFLFWIIYGLLYAAMGYWIMIPICLVSGILAELIIGDYTKNSKVSIAFAVAMFLVAMHPILFVKLLGTEGITKFASSITPEQALSMVEFYTGTAITIAVIANIILELLAGQFGVYINNKFFDKRKEKGILQ
ncbi:MptD family putative ECF transporter S component [Bacillus sp. Hm123]|uniref:MptD family putative ECF transporter S component n=1 Tax=Bacillus sp. Hm123 TaxID=3450745 RepID=UPI003F428C13